MISIRCRGLLFHLEGVPALRTTAGDAEHRAAGADEIVDILSSISAGSQPGSGGFQLVLKQLN